MNGEASADEVQKIHQWVLLLMDKYVSGTASPQEVQLWDAYYFSTIENMAPPNLQQSADDKVLVWEKLMQTIGEKKEADRTQENKKIFAMRWWQRAAVLIGLVGVGLMLYFIWPKQNTTTRIDSPALATNKIYSSDSIKTTILPDGSTITLNRHTAVSYDAETFNQKDRYIYLNNGEAFFDVAKNKEKPFIVNMNGLEVIVVGTSFNIKIYETSKNKSIVVKTGKVMVKHQQKDIATLLPDDMLEYESETGNFKVSKQNSEAAKSWMSGNLVFINAGAAEIKDQLYGFYKTPVSVSSHSIPKGAKFNAVFPKDTPVEKVAATIASVYYSSYKWSGDTLIFYNSTEKK